MTTATPAEYGASYLDEHYPGWADRVDIAKLDVSNPCRCILGQLFSIGSTNGYVMFSSQVPDGLVFRMGFDVPDTVPADLVDETWQCLDAEWSSLVADRQSTNAPSQTDPQEVTAS